MVKSQIALFLMIGLHFVCSAMEEDNPSFPSLKQLAARVVVGNVYAQKESLPDDTKAPAEVIQLIQQEMKELRELLVDRVSNDAVEWSFKNYREFYTYCRTHDTYLLYVKGELHRSIKNPTRTELQMIYLTKQPYEPLTPLLKAQAYLKEAPEELVGLLYRIAMDNSGPYHCNDGEAKLIRKCANKDVKKRLESLTVLPPKKTLFQRFRSRFQ